MARLTSIATGALCLALATHTFAQQRGTNEDALRLLNLRAPTVYLSELGVQTFDYPEVGVQLRQGWNSDRAMPAAANCVTGVARPLELKSNTVTFQDVMDREQVQKAMRASAKGGYGAFSAKASFSRSVNTTSTHRNVLATVDVLSGGQGLVPDEATGRIELTPFALQLLTGGIGVSKVDRLERFYRHCGDSFVAALHRGASLSLLYSFVMDEEDIKQMMSVSAKGGFGGGSASASARQSLTRSRTNTRINIEQIHSGGPAGLPEDVNKSLQRVNDFSVQADSQAVGTTVQVISYRLLANFPRDLRSEGIGSREVYLMLGQVWRLHDLAERYADASSAPSLYYWPNISLGKRVGSSPPVDAAAGTGTAPPAATPADIPAAAQAELSQAARDRSDALYEVAACVQNVVAYCSTRASCAINEVFAKQNLPRVCPGLLDVEKSYSALVTQLFFGAPKATLKSQEMGSEQGRPLLSSLNITSLQRELANSVANVVLAAGQDAKSSIGGQSEAPVDLTPQMVYYALLAEAPLPRRLTDNNQALTAEDFYSHFEKYCKATATPCPSYATLATDQAARNAKAPEILRTYVLRTMLQPLSLTYCREQGHPMCLSQGQLSYLINELQPQFGPSRMFNGLAPIPPITIRKPKEVRPPAPRFWDHDAKQL
jgi:hypothetical protein